jgi:hypothetical protein
MEQPVFSDLPSPMVPTAYLAQKEVVPIEEAQESEPLKC